MKEDDVLKLKMVEKETILNFDEGNPKAIVYTFNLKLKQKLQSLSEKYPNVFRLIKSDKSGAVTYEIPKKRLSVRFSAPISEAEHKRRSEWALKNKPLSNSKQLSSNDEA